MTAGAAVWHAPAVGRVERWARHGLRGATVWFTGLSGSGKSTLANAVAQRLLEVGRAAYVLDGDNLRHGLNADLGFSPADRTENVRRVGEVARLLTDAGLVALVPVISPYRVDRARVRDAHGVDGLAFVEVFVDDYRRHRTTGSFVLFDEAPHQSVAAGMIRLDGGADPTLR